MVTLRACWHHAHIPHPLTVQSMIFGTLNGTKVPLQMPRLAHGTRVGAKRWFRFRLPLIISLLTLLHKSVLEARWGCPSVPRVLPLSDAVLQDPPTESRAGREVCGLY